MTKFSTSDIYPALKAGGFSIIEDYRAWRNVDGRIDVVDITTYPKKRAFGGLLSASHFMIICGSYLSYLPNFHGLRGFDFKNRILPRYWDCHIYLIPRRRRWNLIEYENGWVYNFEIEKRYLANKISRLLTTKIFPMQAAWADCGSLYKFIHDAHIYEGSLAIAGIGTATSPTRNMLLGFLAENAGDHASAVLHITNGLPSYRETADVGHPLITRAEEIIRRDTDN
jgi:hypothetical protein